MKKLILIILVFSFIHLFSQGTSIKELRQQKQNNEFHSTVALIDSKKFEFKADQALPIDCPSIDLSSNSNQLILKDDSLFCDMPFFGRAFNIDYNDQGGFHFSGIVENYNKSENVKKLKINLKFKLKNSSDSYQFLLSITANKSTSLTIISDKRASISYWGKITGLKTNNIP